MDMIDLVAWRCGLRPMLRRCSTAGAVPAGPGRAPTAAAPEALVGATLTRRKNCSIGAAASGRRGPTTITRFAGCSGGPTRRNAVPATNSSKNTDNARP